MDSTATLWEHGHETPTTIEEVIRTSKNNQPGPGEAIGGKLGEGAGLAANRVGSGYRSDSSDMVATKTGGAIGRAAGRAVDNTGRAAGAAVQSLTERVPGTTIAKSVPGALLQEIFEGVTGIGAPYKPPPGVRRNIQQPPAERSNMLRKKRGRDSL